MSILKFVGVGLIGAGCVVSAMMYRDASSSPCCSMGSATTGCAVSAIDAGSCCESSGSGCSSCPASEAGCGEMCPSSGAACPSSGAACPSSGSEAPAVEVVDASAEAAPVELTIAEVTEAAQVSK